MKAHELNKKTFMFDLLIGLYESLQVVPLDDAAIAQLAEHPLSKRKVVGSSPTGGSLFLSILFSIIKS